MSNVDIHNIDEVLKQIREQVASGAVFLTTHARQEMVDEAITTDEIEEALT